MQHPTELRTGVVAAAIDLFASQGFEATSVDALVAAADKAGRGLWSRAAAAQLLSARQDAAARGVLESRLDKDPDDMITAQLALELANVSGDDEAKRAAARRILDRAQLPTGLSAFVQAESRSRALQVLLDSAIMAASAPNLDPARKAELGREIDDNRAKLLEAQQNDVSTPVMLSSDAKIAQSKGVSIGIVATPAPHAQEAADALVRAGIGSILNFAPTVLSVPRGVNVRKVDLALELQILSYHEQSRANTLRAVPGSGKSASA